jgi:serine-type D-Ala-D-Ala carboxypeptidase (penicillin-binding protein 5/6)
VPRTGGAPARGPAALLILLVLALIPSGAGATTTATPTATPTPAPAVVDAPLQAGRTPAEVADAVVPGPRAEPPDISAAGAVLYDPADRVVLAGVDERTARRMASTTKIMTVLVALEAFEAGLVGEDVAVSAAAAATGQLPGVATLGLVAGDVVPLRDLLAADLLRSGNDGAVAIAEHVAGSEPAYVSMMNARARSLGLEDTAFLDASGLTDDPAHHATPLDLALLGEEAMRHPDFAAWAGADALDVPPFGTLENRNELIGTYAGTTGVKTGFTNLAGQCLVASVERDGRTLYVVVLGSEDRVADATALFDHGFTDYLRPTPLRPGEAATTYRTARGDVAVSVAEDLARTVGVGAEVAVQVRLAPDVGLPIEVGTPLGEAVLLVDGEAVDRAPLQADEAVGAAPDSAGAALADALRAFARLAPRTEPVPL